MATRDDIAALTAFCECEQALEQHAASRAASLKPIAEKRDATMQRIMDAMQRAKVKCISLPPDLVDNARFVRIVDVRSQRDITPNLVKLALTNALSEIDARVDAQAREDDTNLEDVLQQALLSSVKEARTTTHSTVSFSNNRPRGVGEESIPVSQSNEFKNEVKLLANTRDEYAQQVQTLRARQKELEEKRETVLLTVRGYMDRMERDTQPIVLSGGASGSHATLKRKVVTHKAPLTVDQFKSALHAALQDTREAHGFSRYTPELWKAHRASVMERLLQRMNEMRVVDRTEVFKLHRTRRAAQEAEEAQE